VAGFSVKEVIVRANESLTGKGQGASGGCDQALAGLMKPNLVRALIQRGALR